MEALTSAIGDELDELAGLRFTRLTSDADVGDVTIDVETTVDWPAVGSFRLGKNLYTYSAKTPTTFTGVSPAIVDVHIVEDEVVDASGTYSAVDLARNMMIVDTAEEEFLTALAGNYGVPRVKGINDTTFRAFVRAVAFGPKATIYLIEQALDALLGVGTYTIFEDLINFPHLVFISFNSPNVGAPGKSFMTASDAVTSSTTTAVAVVDAPVGGSKDSVRGVFLAPGLHTADGIVKPSAEATVWTYGGGTAEGTDVTLNGDGSVRLKDTSAATIGAYYSRALNVIASSEIVAEWTVSIVSSSGTRGCALGVSDGGHKYGVSLQAALIQLVNLSTGALLGTGVVIAAGYHKVKLRKPGGKRNVGPVELWVDDVLISTVSFSGFPTTTDKLAEFGSFTPASGQATSDWAFLRVSTFENVTNFWNGANDADDAITEAAHPDRITADALALFVPAKDVAGRQIRLSQSTVDHGRGNGLYKIATVDAGGLFVTVTGVPYPGLVVAAVDKIQIPANHRDKLTAEDAGVQAILNTGAGNAKILWTAKYGGVDGNAASVQLIDPGANNIPLSIAVATTDDIKVTLRTGPSGTILSTAAEIIAAAGANSTVTAFASAALGSGSNGTGVVSAVGTTNLAGGEDGKKLTIAGSTHGGNNATRKIATLIDEHTALLGSHLTPAALTVDAADTAMTWRKDPNFDDDSSLSWETIATGTLAGVNLTMRRALPAATTSVVATYYTVFSAHMLADEFVANPTGAIPALYLYDGFARIRDVIKSLLAAGVWPRFRQV